MQLNNSKIYNRLKSRQTSLAVVGLGYVGLPVLMEFSRHFNVIGYDIDHCRINYLRNSLKCPDSSIKLTECEKDLSEASFYIVTVQTPIDSNRNPDLSKLIAATETIGKHLQPGSYVIFESSVHPGCTENICIPLLEQTSGLSAGIDFKVGYSPERINPNDDSHTFSNTVKIVSATDSEALEEISAVYQLVIKAGIHKAPDIKTAEAAKMLENTQRNVNIALINELSKLYSSIGIDTYSVIEAAATKWNFANYYPGLVGGHCIPVDPFYLVSQAENAGIDVPLIKTACSVNENMGFYIIRQAYQMLTRQSETNKQLKALVMGVTYKENIDDIRNTPAITMIKQLEQMSVSVDAVDPLANPDKVMDTYGITLSKSLQPPYDLIITTVGHDEYKNLDDSFFRSIAKSENSLLVDIRAIYRGKIKSLRYMTL
ncbi:nucleotide sugar dehydrogenase [Muribaculum caecicola]|jgi:UDP-N-acetyl-D-galactosamine dehydrogenase|uniref:Nucleotide sugar dehydrogenase n=1 Tax=Muribaculum caecicola TaxID=3038144 RepID=A0AC61S8T1_9BACT|nr:nucleotide sugar dehydrogenase [Muribaculum caecicola]THG55313.1 nucleotide sugar dehydrogenase [Muribaculum caecicola]